MRRKYFLGGVIFVILTIFIIFIVTKLTFKEDTIYKLDVYYLSNSTNELVPEEISITNIKDYDELVQEVMQKLASTPENQALSSVVPSEVELLSYNLDSTVLQLNFSDEYKDITESKELLFRASLVYTFTGIDGIEEIEILISGEPLKKLDSEEMGTLSRSNVFINPVIETGQVNIENVTLYFSDEMGEYLVTENRNIEIKQGESIENQIIEQLIAGPETNNLFATVPPETKIRNIKTEEGICYVDLSNEFVSKHSGGSTLEILTIYSIVNSLTELEVVNSVQFLVEGEKVNTFKGHLDISKPFERDEEIILK